MKENETIVLTLAQLVFVRHPCVLKHFYYYYNASTYFCKYELFSNLRIDISILFSIEYNYNITI